MEIGLNLKIDLNLKVPGQFFRFKETMEIISESYDI